MIGDPLELYILPTHHDIKYQIVNNVYKYFGRPLNNYIYMLYVLYIICFLYISF